MPLNIGLSNASDVRFGYTRTYAYDACNEHRDKCAQAATCGPRVTGGSESKLIPRIQNHIPSTPLASRPAPPRLCLCVTPLSLTQTFRGRSNKVTGWKYSARQFQWKNTTNICIKSRIITTFLLFFWDLKRLRSLGTNCMLSFLLNIGRYCEKTPGIGFRALRICI